MSARRLAGALALGAALAGCGSESREPAPEAPPSVPMPAEQDVLLPITSAYSFVQAAFSIGDATNFVRGYADSATLYVPGYGRMVGRNHIARDFAREGRRLGVQRIERTSAGRYIEGRDVIDSGRYAFVTSAPLPEGSLDVEGRYWTRWRHLADGTWTIISDSLAPIR